MKKSVPKLNGLAVPALLGGLLLLPAVGQATSLTPESLSAALFQAADAPVTGRITDESGAGIPGVTVLVKGTSTATQTDADGRYSIVAPAGATLVFSFVGYASQEVAVGGRTSIDAKLAVDAQGLSEVVVVGYLTQNRQNVSSAVSSLDVKEATKAPVPTVTQALQGRLPGVQVQGSGGPGDAPVVTIRGIGTLGAAGSSPLYVIDGLWTFNIRDLNPNDIESLTVLKDASSTAVYGSSGANGVVLITTKKGKAGRPSVSFNGYRGFDQLHKRYNLTNASQWADRAVIAYSNAGLNPLNNGQNGLAGAVKGPGGAFNPTIDTDWQKEFFQTGTLEDYNVAFSGGNIGEKSASNFLISGDYFHQQGIVKGPDFQRFSLRLNSGLTRGRFKFQQNAQLTHIDATLLNGGSFIDVLTIIPTIPVHDPANEGGFGTGSPILNTFATNPIGAQELLRRTQADNRLAGNASMDVALFDFLSYRLNAAIDGHMYSNADAQKSGILRQNTRINTSSLNEFLGYDVFLLAENTLNFTKSFGDHHVNVLGGYSEQRYRQHNVQAGTQGFTSLPQYYFELDAGSTKGVIGGSTTENAKRSFFSQATYDYKNRYLISGSFRRDGSSKFAPQNRWANFGAASLGWRISEEDFFKNALPQVNNLKLRVSYGGNGNDGLAGRYGGNYLTTPIIGQNVNYVIGTGQTIVNGSTQLALSSPDLQWEERFTKNGGLDLSVLDNRLTLSADYYIAETRKALAPVQVPTYLGHFGDVLYQNAGNIENRGFELALGYHAGKKEFTYGADFTLTTIKNKITALPVKGQAFEGGEGVTRSELGTGLGEFYLIPFAGIFQSKEEVLAYKNAAGTVIQPYASAGDVRYTDVNGDGKIDNADRVYSGSAIPKLQLGLNLNAAYKGFDFSLFLQSATGNKIYNTARVALESYNGPNNYNADVTPWSSTNPSTTTPRLLQGGGATPDLIAAAASNARFNSTRWLEDGSYLRLKNVQLGYTFPQNMTSFMPSLGSVRVYVTGRNVVTFTKYTGFDPEITGTGFYSRGVDNSAYPNVRSFIGGLQVNF
ncbi:TonB-dependent receptor [Hymenobacter sp. BT770]|uniref:SusC/RagA family TonB-linked outer membrane protein n=1 Tax=Hymenobacter sp. BT770 TaxID=2886942 RepID=UPI001D11D070|nr:TonB-dependent receptor [Hymenobacter sp. BT770]MCC3154414.1 TonB-dependent receptor [Hymenobacter sp. BT770]MDO3416285.1 TonB-dependent receptor [Hymenobacter sp. BT770]